MKKYAIKDGNDKLHQSCACLLYDELTKEFRIKIPEDVMPGQLPAILSVLVKKGQRDIGPDWSLRWVQDRITPPNRQALGIILKANGMTEYDEFAFLMKSQGRTCQDDFYLEEWKEECE